MNLSLTPLERLRQSGIVPERALGQNFLIDPNILDVIERAAALGSDDVVLEVGPGVGVLTALLVKKCAAVHCIEVDKRLAGLLREEFEGRPGFHLHLGDAVGFDFSTLDPPPSKFVSNLPYNVATPLVIKSLQELPSVRIWCLMVQKEIADRLFAATGSSSYGSVSVMTRLLSEKISSRTISPAVFFPKPRVRSSLLVFKRQRPHRYTAENFAAVKEIVYASFSHRRKKLINSLAEADPPPGILGHLAPAQRRKLAEDLLTSMGLAPRVRPQELKPEQFEEFAALLMKRRNHIKGPKSGLGSRKGRHA